MCSNKDVTNAHAQKMERSRLCKIHMRYSVIQLNIMCVLFTIIWKHCNSVYAIEDSQIGCSREQAKHARMLLNICLLAAVIC